VLLTHDKPMQIMLREGIFAKYDAPSAKSFAQRKRQYQEIFLR